MAIPDEDAQPMLTFKLPPETCSSIVFVDPAVSVTGESKIADRHSAVPWVDGYCVMLTVVAPSRVRRR